MKQLEFNAKYENKNKFRFYNWENFIEEKIIFNNEKNKYLLIILHFNNLFEISKLIKKHILNESLFNEKFDVLIIDNFSETNIFKKLKEICKKYKISLIRTKLNLGGAGGYSMGIEYFIKNKNYSYLIISEDDAIPLQKNTISKMIEKSIKNKNYIIKIKYFEFNCPSFGLHFIIYPRTIINLIGVLNIFYFMRADDLEYYLRIIRLKKDKTKVINTLFYTHPTIKGYSFNLFFDYLSKRNSLDLISKFSNFKLLFNQLIILYISLLNGLFFYLKNFELDLLTPFFISIYDFLFKKDSNLLNLKRKEYLIKSSKKLDNKYYNNINKNDKLIVKINNKYKTLSILNFQNGCFKDLKKGWSFNGFVTDNYYYPFYFLGKLSKKYIIIPEINYYSNSVPIYIEKNKNIVLNYFIFIISMIFSIILFVIILPFILIKIILNKILS